MGITAHDKKQRNGTIAKVYTVVAEAINKYTGKRHQKKKRGVSSLLKAERVYRELWNQCKEERPDGPPIKTWGELKAKYLASLEENKRSAENVNGNSPKMIESRKSKFIHFGKDWETMHLELVTAQLVKEHLDVLESEGKASRSLTRDIQKAVSAMMTFAVNSGALKAHPLDRLAARRVPKRKKISLTHDEANKLILEAWRRNHPYYLVWLLTIALGLRRSELDGLKWTDLDLDNGLASLCRQYQPKEGLVAKLKDYEDRVVSIPKIVIPVLKEYRLRATTEFVIELDCKQWEGGHQAQVIRAFCAEIGIREITHHQLRNTHITLAIIDGVPVGIVKDNVGHAKLSTTDGYYASSGIQMKGQLDRLQLKVPGMQGKVSPLKAAK